MTGSKYETMCDWHFGSNDLENEYLASIFTNQLAPFPGVVPLDVGEDLLDLTGFLRRALGTRASEDERRQGCNKIQK